jgi:hypothetical protein
MNWTTLQAASTRLALLDFFWTCSLLTWWWSPRFTICLLYKTSSHFSDLSLSNFDALTNRCDFIEESHHNIEILLNSVLMNDHRGQFQFESCQVLLENSNDIVQSIYLLQVWMNQKRMVFLTSFYLNWLSGSFHWKARNRGTNRSTGLWCELKANLRNFLWVFEVNILNNCLIIIISPN